MIRVRATTALLLAASAGFASAGPLHLKAGTVQTQNLPDLRAAIARAEAIPSRVIVQLDAPMTPQRRVAMEAAGLRLLDYIPDHAFIVDTRNADPGAIAALSFVQAVVPFQDNWKIEPELGAREYHDPELRLFIDAGELPAVVVLFPGADPDRAAARFAERAVTVVAVQQDRDRYTFDVLGEEAALRSLASLESVSWIEPAPEVTFRSNTNTRWIIQTNVLNLTPVYNAGIRGEGQIIAIMDGRVNPNHCSFSDPGVPFGNTHRKIQAYNTSTGADFHGTHVAGTALGDAGANDNTRGIAYASRLVFGLTASSGSYTSMYDKLNLHYSQGATIHTNSWGNDGTTAYDNWARAIDAFSWDRDDNLVLFAVTNTSTLRNPENAKNVLAVGATGPSGSQQNHCTGGRGPTNDGRRKPEIYTPGCSTVSSSGTCSTSSSSGTSMASPAVAGAAALARQYYTEGFYPSGQATPSDAFTPSGTLVKATLLNATVDMTGVSGYPSDLEGWGRLTLDNALSFAGQSRTLIVRDVRNNADDALSTSDVIEVPFEVTSSAQELRVTLVWHDAPAALNTSFAAINNLDLELEAGAGTLYRGNVFASGVSTTGGTADIRNNVEMIRLTAPAAGEYTARIRATAVNVGAQGYALVITGAVAENTFPGCSIADLTEPFGVLDLADAQAFVTAFIAQDPAADLAAPLGVFDIADVQAFNNAFITGCP